MSKACPIDNNPIEQDKLVCKCCWYRLPVQIRTRVTHAWKLYSAAAQNSEQFPDSTTCRARLKDRLNEYAAARKEALDYLQRYAA